MGKIHVLDIEVSNKIAAGEVVERPVSVIKELVENSIDAKAASITVEIRNGGRTYMRVTDNGTGMAPEDAQIAFLRHATSKIEYEQDLDAIYTLGFRGEALSSIGAVAQVDLYTKRRQDDMGTHVICNGGEIISSDDAGAADGTTFVVKDLFYNTPARMKFMKKDAAEAGHIQDLMARFILAYPEISFRFINSGKQVLFSPGDHNLLNAVYTVYGKDYAKNVLPVDYENDGIRVTGVAGKGTLMRPKRNFQSYFVNKRYIKSAMLVKALEEAYKNQIMIGKYPMAVLNIEINPSMIDINVHPTKLEVKFSDEKRVYEAVYYAVKNALYATVNIPQIEAKEEEEKGASFVPETGMQEDLLERIARDLPRNSEKTSAKEQPVRENHADMTAAEYLARYSGRKKGDGVLREVKERDIFAAKAASPQENIHKSKPQALSQQPREEGDILSVDTQITKNVSFEVTSDKTAGSIPQKTEENPPRLYIPDVKIIGQVFDTYIVAQREEEMLLVDQHAAHERIKYEELKRAVAQKRIYPQILLEPVTITLSGSEMAAFEQFREQLYHMGFEADIFGEREVIVRTSPDGVEWSDVEGLFVELLGQMEGNKKEVMAAGYERALYTIACKSAIKANHNLTQQEMERLVRDILSLENINTCPHGRPIMISMSKREMEKQFKRIV